MAIKLLYPVTGPITQVFGVNPDLYAQWGFPGHNGVDFGVPNATPVKAAAAGVVDKVSFENGGYGNYVKLRHTDGATTFYTYYAHLLNAAVSAGQSVAAGDVVGYSDSTGASSGPHLHFGLRIMEQNPAYKGYLDPLPYLTAGGGEPSGGEISGAIDIPEMEFEVAAETLNVRSGPGITYPILEQLTQGAVVSGKRLHSESAWIELAPGKWCALTFDGVQYLKVKEE